MADGKPLHPPLPPSEFPRSVSHWHTLSLCRRQPALGPALPSSGQANQPKASALAPFPVSGCRLPALSEGQLSAVRPTPLLQTTIKSPLFWAGGEKWEETDAPYTKTRFPQFPSKQHTELAVPHQSRALVPYWWASWVNWQDCSSLTEQTGWVRAHQSCRTLSYCERFPSV